MLFSPLPARMVRGWGEDCADYPSRGEEFSAEFLCGRIRNGVKDRGYGLRGGLRDLGEDLGVGEVTGED